MEFFYCIYLNYVLLSKYFVNVVLRRVCIIVQTVKVYICKLVMCFSGQLPEKKKGNNICTNRKDLIIKLYGRSPCLLSRLRTNFSLFKIYKKM